MKKLLFILAFAVLGMAANAQVAAVKVLSIDTLTAATTDTSAVAYVSGSYNAITFQALCTELGGTSDGTLRLEGSVDGLSYLTLESGIGYAYPNDTLDVSSGAIWQFKVNDAPFKYYRVIGLGTANDTTLVTLKYILK
ncbi:hypothetical protein RPMD05_76 [Rhodobacteraceae phage LS06-2018-MD05]|nr:hypothetical protein RPMD05_76 [Rhodobacteraceae phage LS06-2018-MD05]